MTVDAPLSPEDAAALNEYLRAMGLAPLQPPVEDAEEVEVPALSPAQQQAFEERLARHSFPAYVHLMHIELTGRPFQEREFHTTIMDFLQQAYEGKVIYGDINMPPRYGKTYLMCLWISWCFGQYPDCWFLYISMAAELAEQSAMDVKKFMKTPLYKRLFPNTVIERTSDAREKFFTTAGGRMLSRGIGGLVTGYGGGILGIKDRFSGALIVDDLLKMQDARSVAMKTEGIEFAKGTLSSRQNTERAPVIFIGQRGATDDIFSYLHPANENDPALWGKRWVNLTMPALDANDESVWPEHKSTQWCHEFRAANPWEWETQYMQKPYNASGTMFKVDMMRTLHTRPLGPFRVCRCWDLAARKPKQGRTEPDYTASVKLVYYYDSQEYVIEDAFKFRDRPDVVRRTMLQTAHRDGHDVYIRGYQDPGQAGVAQVEDLTKLLDGYKVAFVPVRTDKVVNAEPVAAQFNVGLVSVLAPYEQLVKGELTPFPDGKHDDLVDALAGAYAFLAIPDEDEASRRRAVASLMKAGAYTFGEGLERELKEGVEQLRPGFLPGEEEV